MRAAEKILNDLRKLGDPRSVAGMSRFGINTETDFGIKLPILRAYGKKYKRNHSLAVELWDTGFHEAPLLAVFIADPKQVTSALMGRWLKDFDFLYRPAPGRAGFRRNSCSPGGRTLHQFTKCIICNPPCTWCIK